MSLAPKPAVLPLLLHDFKLDGVEILHIFETLAFNGGLHLCPYAAYRGGKCHLDIFRTVIGDYTERIRRLVEVELATL